ncbi:MAG: Asp-tRNA(Asn)/Glu-tRNA(Gln) amidotransferase subunit GatC [Saprospiraceae bacterium]
MVFKLELLNTTDVKPLIHLSQCSNVMRTDKVKNQIAVKDALTF